MRRSVLDEAQQNEQIDREDAALIERLRAGDPEAAAVLYARNYQDAVLTVLRKLPSREVAAECASEAFAKVLEIISRGKGPTENFRAYLRTTVRRVSIDWYRDRDQLTTTEAIEDNASFSIPAADEAMRQETADILNALYSLPEHWQRILILRIVEDKKPAEIAKILDVDSAALKTMITRAKHRLRSEYVRQVLRSRVTGPCIPFCELLVQQAIGTLSATQRTDLEQHQPRCADCQESAQHARLLMKRFSPAALAVALGALSQQILLPDTVAAAAAPVATTSTSVASAPASPAATPVTPTAVNATTRVPAAAGTRLRAWLRGFHTGAAAAWGPVIVLLCGIGVVAAAQHYGAGALTAKVGAPSPDGTAGTVPGGGAAGEHPPADHRGDGAPECELRVQQTDAGLTIEAITYDSECWLSVQREGAAQTPAELVQGRVSSLTKQPGTYHIELSSSEGTERRTVTLGTVR